MRMLKQVVAGTIVFGLILPMLSFGAMMDMEDLVNRKRFDYRTDPVLKHDKLAGLGYLDVTLYGADPKGLRDSTDALQKAIDLAYRYEMVCFFPEGTYLVSDTLQCIRHVVRRKKARAGKQAYTTPGNEVAHVLHGSTRGRTRPVLKLKSHAAGFDSPASPKPVVTMWSMTSGKKVRNKSGKLGGRLNRANHQENISFNMGFKGIDIYIGAGGNRGAIGIDAPGAQGSYVEDVKITLNNGLAGISGLPGRTGLTCNIEIVGGRHGIYYDSSGIGSSMVGIRFVNQTGPIIGFGKPGMTPLVLSGFEVVKESGPIYVLPSSLKGRKRGCGYISFVDGRIHLKRKSALIEAVADKSIYLRNVYVQNGEAIIEGDRVTDITAGSGRYAHVIEYADCADNSFNVIQGRKNRDRLIKIDKRPGSIPGDMVKMHTWPEVFPSFEDKDAVNIKELGAAGDGKTDDTAVFKRALGSCKKIFLPKGEYIVSDTLTLGRDQHMFGVSKTRSIIKASDAWKPTTLTPVVQTVDDKDAVSSLSFLGIRATVEEVAYAYFILLNWRAGRNSIVRDITNEEVGFWSGKPSQASEASTGRPNVLITGHGGGKWYCLNSHKGYRTVHPDFRRLLVKGTSEPLNFYGLNVERSRGEPQFEVVDSSDVTVHGFKVEFRQAMKINRSAHVSVYGYTGSGNTFEVADSRDVTLVNLMKQDKEHAKYVVLENFRGKTASHNFHITLYKR